MSAVVFLGPTLDLASARAILASAIYLPPARQGDVLRAAQVLRPASIAIVDGYFRQAPAVWHKEILWCLKQHIRVLGAASMGALRAAELAPFGMRGVGRIYDAYASSVFAPYFDEPFENDDEVAVAHAPAQAGYIASEALVNMRATLAAAHRERIIEQHVRDQLLCIAKSMFFMQRTFSALLARAREAGLDAAALHAFEQWLPQGRVDQKREDAVALLEAMARDDDSGPPGVKDFAFERTTMWERVEAGVAQQAHAPDPVLNEVRLDPNLYRRCVRAATLHLLGVHAPEQADDGEPSLRAACDLDPHADVLAQLAQHGHDEARCCALLRRELAHDALREDLRQVPRTIVLRQVGNALTRAGLRERLMRRAHAKQRALAAAPAHRCVDDLNPLQLLDLCVWFFREILGRPYAGRIEAHLDRLGFDSAREFYRVVLDERLYREQRDASGA